MPSIGDLEKPRSGDRVLVEISSVISEELVGQNTSSLISTGINASTRKDLKPVGTITTMAPNKDGTVQSEPKHPVESMKQGKPLGSADAKGFPVERASGIEQQNGVETSKEMNGQSTVKQGNDDHQGEGEKINLTGGDENGEKEKTAEEKRKDYKARPRATSVEILGLKKTPMAKIANQGHLDEEIFKGFEHGMMRRKSSPAKFRYGATKIEEPQKGKGDVDSLAVEIKTMKLDSSDKTPGFGQRIEAEGSQSSNLVAKGPMRPGQPQARHAPYQTGQTTIAFHSNQVPVPVPQIVHTQMQQSMYQDPSCQQFPGSRRQGIIRPSTKIVSVPGMPSKQQHNVYTHTQDGRVLQNIGSGMQPSSMQMNQPMTAVRRIPVEDSWPPSPGDGSYPNSPGGSESLSPSHLMPSSPSPSYSSPAHPHPSPMMPSPQSTMSQDSYGMTMSPCSPHSPDMGPLKSPPSVGSIDSGIASPPHQNVNQYTTFTSTGNSGTVIINSQPVPNEIIHLPVTNYQYQVLNDDAIKERKILEIETELRQYVENVQKPNSNIMHPNLPQPQRPMMQSGRYVTHEPQPQIPSPRPIQNCQPQTSPNQAQNLENLVNNMPLDVLCSLDEDEDTALHIAISQGNLQLCQAIINRLVREGRPDALNIKDKLGQTPLYIAVVTNQPNLLFLLLQAGADVMIPTKERTTPLHYAATKGYSHALVAIGYCLYHEMIKNWNINIEDKNGMSPLQCAIQAHGRFEQVYDGVQCTYVNKMVDSLDTIKNLLKLGADPAFQDRRSGYTALHFAMEVVPNGRVTPNTHIMNLILEWNRDAQALLAIKNYAGNTPLHVIAGRDYDEDYLISVVNLLISYGSEITVSNYERNQPHDLVKKTEKPTLYSRLQGDHLQGK